MITTYFRRRSAIAMARLFGSLTSSGFGRPWPTSQNGQRRVQMSPMIMNVAVPPEKHSPRLGQDASSQTLCSLCLRSNCLIRSTSGETGMRTRIQSGFFGRSTVGMILTGMRATFSAPRSLTPASTFGRATRSETSSVGIRVCTVSVIMVYSARKGRLLSVVEVFDELRTQSGTYLGKFYLPSLIAQLGHGQSGVSARVDAAKRLKVHVDVQRQTMKRTAVANAQTERRYFRAVNVYAGGISLGCCLDAVVGEQGDEGVLDPGDQIANAETKAPDVQHQISHQLARAMISHLAATIDLYDRNITRQQQMLGLAGLSLGENRRMLDQPDFIGSLATTLVGKALHGVPGGFVIDQAQITKTQRSRHQSTMCTKPVARNALLISRNWSSPVATMCSCTVVYLPLLL
ncbi:Uncharacterized protein ALO42_05448 [Pseudomonas syringae pv. atrofaciens]|nr:Uncharacterized protein ALO42_05448 [Pseudomonas syringae pv. atrofaciens]